MKDKHIYGMKETGSLIDVLPCC